MLTIENNNTHNCDFESFARLRSVPIGRDWCEAPKAEAKIHRIHPYPAKFPAFLVDMAFRYAAREGIAVSTVADVFCGCGTVGYEASSRDLDFWGCDINPVATLIAQVKAFKIDPLRFKNHVQSVIARVATASPVPAISADARARLEPWYDQTQFEALSRLSNAIRAESEATDEYRMALECAFSAIVKSASRWRSRSIKPAKDFAKAPPEATRAFERQCKFMIEAWRQGYQKPAKRPKILQGNVTEICGPPTPVDLIVTSPPYVTSYEYADLHQLSALWLGYAEDHRSMRNGIIGTGHRRVALGRALKELNPVATRIVFSLFDKNRSLAEAVAAYFLDMQVVARRCFDFVRPGGLAVFVVGNTKLNGVLIDNANHLVESLMSCGFSKIRAVKRVTTNKANTPFRSPDGRLSASPTDMNIYGDEYILMAHRP